MMRNTRYNPRILHLSHDEEFVRELQKIGVIDPGVHRMVPKGRSYVLKLDDVDAPQAHVLKEVFLSVGGDAAVNREIMTYEVGKTDVILIGTRKQFSNAGRALLYETELDGPIMSAAIEAAIARYDHGPVSPDLNDISDPKAGWMYREMANRTLVMGILNVTPDSFSDGGRYLDHSAAVEHALTMVEQGADIIDVGGESTRPGSDRISSEGEIDRVVPVIRELAGRTDRPISIDTYKADTARAALDAGASVINDISGMAFDPDMPALAAERKCPVVLMHIKGTPKEMQQNPEYDDLMGEIIAYLRDRTEAVVEAGLDERMVIVDPGIGFGKTIEHNLEILRRLPELKTFGRPILVGASRKATIGHVLGGLPPEERVEGTAAVTALSIASGANIVRVHDVKEMARVAKMTDAIVRIQDSGVRIQER